MSNHPIMNTPNGWIIQRLEAIAECITGTTPPASASGAWGEDVPFVTPGDIDKYGNLLPTTRSLSSHGRRYVRELPPGSVLMTCIGVIGKIAVTETVVATNQQINAAVPQPGVLSSYLRAVLQLETSQANALAGIQVMPILNLAKFKSLRLAVPPLGEQRRIAEILDTADGVIRSTEQLIAKLEQAKQGLLHDLIVRRSWPTSPVREVALKVTDGDHHTPMKSAGGGIPLIGAGNVQDGYLDLSSDEFVDEGEYARMITRCHPEAGDILISCSGSIGRVAQVPAGLRLALVRSVALVKPDTGKCLSGFLELALQSPFVQRQIKNTQKQLAQANLFQGAISELRVPLPEVSRQRAIVEHVTSYRAAITTAAQELSKLRLLKRGLMDDLLTGRVRLEAVP
jgi:type I restriction enzyme, S subunit